MSKFETYLINEARTKSLTGDQFVRLARKNCKKAVEAYNRGHRIYRGLDTPVNTGVAYVDPRNFVRKSANTENFYTLIMSYHTYWKKFPTRNRSIICTTDPETASVYGNRSYVVLPYDGANIGIAPKGDIWVSFKIPDLEWVNSELKDIFNILNIKWSDEDWSKFKKALAELSDIYEKMYKLDLLEWGGLDDLNDFYKEFNKNKKEFKISAHEAWNFVQHTQKTHYGFAKYPVDKVRFDDWFFNMLHPVLNKFRVAKIGMPLPKGEHELWIADPCLLHVRMLDHDPDFDEF